nr:MAG: capsid protein [Cressdnaviricota sp.]
MPHRRHRLNTKPKHKKGDLRRQVATIKSQMKPALKYFDLGGFPNWTSVQQVGYQLNVVPEGTADDNRTGLHILNKWVQVNIAFTTNITTPTTATQSMIRVVLMLIKEQIQIEPEQPNLTNPQSYLGLANETGPGSGNGVLATRNPTMYSDYTVLHDKVYTPDTNSDSRTMTVKINKRLNLKTTFYQGSTQIQKGSVYLMMFRDQLDTGTATILTAWNSRVFYTDA